MKGYKVLIVMVMGVLLSCNRNDVEPLPQKLPIQYEFEPEYIVFNRTELTSEELEEMPDISFVINSEDEFPDEDLMWLNPLKESNIDFQAQTLLLNYEKIPNIVTGHRYSWTRNEAENKYNFYMYFSTEPSKETENPGFIFTYYRTAVLVKKIPTDTEVEFWYSIN